MLKPFLTANWRYLAMLNFVVDPKILEPLVPPGTELDFYGGQTFLSVVGFLFLDTRVVGLPIPLHRDFEEVNLRFYVRRQNIDGWRRGVTFVREFVPRPAIAIVARTFTASPYTALPMRHSLEHKDGAVLAEYQWRRGKRWETLGMTALDEPKNSTLGSHEEFIMEHYWGYTARRDGTSEYRVEHPRWRFWNAQTWKFEADVATLYGSQFVEALSAPPVSAFIAEGARTSKCAGARASWNDLSFLSRADGEDLNPVRFIVGGGELSFGAELLSSGTGDFGCVVAAASAASRVFRRSPRRAADPVGKLSSSQRNENAGS